MATVLPARERLVAIANVLDQAHDGHDLAVYVTDDGDAFDLGIRPLDPHQHPCDELRGLIAPDDWWAVGIVVTGRARFLDRPDRPPEPTVTTYLVERGGAEVSLMRRGAEVTESRDRVEGRIPDLCRTILGVP